MIRHPGTSILSLREYREAGTFEVPVKGSLRRGTALAFTTVTALLLVPTAADAESFNVNTTADGNDFNSADPVCDADPVAPGLQCTLRAAIQQAETPPSQDMINLPAGTYTLNSPNELEVDSDLIIDGAGAASTVIRQQLNGRVIEVQDTVGRLDLRDVTVSNGVIAADGGGILALEALTLRRVVVKGNQAFGDGDDGGGIAARLGAELTIVDSVIGDPAGGGAGNRGATGGGISADCSAGTTLTLRRSVVVGNTATHTTNATGGGLDSCVPAPETNVIEDSHFLANRADFGAGLFVSGDIRIEGTTVSGNVSAEEGALLGAFGRMELSNSTISGNSALPGGSSSGVSLGTGAAGSSVVNSTFATNTPAPGDAADLTADESVTVRGSIFASSSGPRCIEAPGPITSAGFNVESGSSCGFASAGDRSSVNPRLGPLASNGGLTPTHALEPGSPAINLVSGGCPPPATDQRGVPRPQGPRCDSGAHEFARCAGTVVNRVGGPGPDVVLGTSGVDGFLLLGGDDRASGRGGRDALCGGSGKDKLRGNGGADRLLGQAGGDRLLGGSGRDLLNGGPGRDRLLGGPGRDRLRSGPGRDRQRQ